MNREQRAAPDAGAPAPSDLPASYEIVEYRPELKPQIARLQTHLWSPDVSANTAYFEWKYERNPYVSTPLIRLALHRGEVVGMRGMYGAKWQVGDPPQSFMGPCAADFVIAPEHRNGGLAARILEATTSAASHRYPYVFNFWTENATQVASLMSGWRSAGPLEVARFRSRSLILRQSIARRLASLRFLWRLDGWLGLSAAQSRVRLPRGPADRAAGARRRGGGHVHVERTPRAAEMAGLVERLRSDGRIRHVRDREYFEWRYQNPLSRYQFLFWIGDRLEGYLVLRASARGFGGAANIADWEASTEEIRAELLRKAIRWSGCNEFTLWSSTLPAEVRGLLQRNRFEFLPGAPSLARAHRLGQRHATVLVRPSRLGIPKADDWTWGGRSMLDLGNWDLRMIYADM